MNPSKHRITFKIIIGYVIIGVLSTIFGVLVLSEIKTFTKLQGQGITDQNKILKVGSLIADIYENESLARAAIQLNSSKKFNEYVQENKHLLLRIDSLIFFTNKGPQEFIFDSIKVVINKKLKNITDLKNLKRSYNSEEPISTVINKLNAIDSLLAKDAIDDIIKNPNFLDIQARLKFEKYTKILNNYNPKDTDSIDQKKIDSLISISKDMLEKAQKKTIKQRFSLLRKERQLIESDLIISRKLQELLSNLESGLILYNNNINEQREKTLNRSKNIILYATGISLLIIIIFSVIILNDFWKSQRYRKQLEKANETTSSLLKSREQIISMVSHDLRTPLSTITGYSELLQKKIYNTKEENYVEHISNASTYMGKLVDDLMEFSKLENGNIPLQSIPFDLKKLINEILLNAKNSIQNKPIDFVVKYDKELDDFITSDPFRLKQILSNLIINACKFTNEGTITIENVLIINADNTFLKTSITDTGVGISEDLQKNIFKAFTQGTPQNEKKEKGFGLGLTISKKLTELLKGSLTLKSEISKGSTFTLKIPVVLSKKPTNTQQLSEPDPIFNLSAIVVEDDASMRQLLKDLLLQYNIKSYTFNNAQLALQDIHKIQYDLVITDIQLPKMNGIHFMETLKKSNFYENQPIIAMTGRLNLAIEDYLDNGFSGVLIKPFHRLELQKILQQFFGSSLIKTKTKPIVKEDDKIYGYTFTSLKAFLKDDDKALKKTLTIFLEDTKKNNSILKIAKKNNDITTINGVSHRMLSMFRQLKVEDVTLFLEAFENAKFIEDATFKDFENALKKFIKSLESYLN